MLKEAKHPANLHGHRPEKVEINCFAKCLDRKGSDILKALAHQDEINGLSKGIFFSFILTKTPHHSTLLLPHLCGSGRKRNIKIMVKVHTESSTQLQMFCFKCHKVWGKGFFFPSHIMEDQRSDTLRRRLL